MQQIDPSETNDANDLARVRLDVDNSLLDQCNHEFGLEVATSREDVPIVCCLVRDGAYWLPAFLDHYRILGVKEFFFLDNGSEDATLELLEPEDGVGVYSVPQSLFKDFNSNLRRILVQLVRPRGWTICVDIDEFLDFPYSETFDISQLCRYFDRSGFNCMSTHMLDMFSDCSLDELHAQVERDPRYANRYYSMEGMKRNTYRSIGDIFESYPADALQLPASDWKFYCDGLRFEKFGAGVWLTKHALFRMDGSLVPFLHPHLHIYTNIANVSGVLYHYKFTPHFLKHVERAVQEGQYYGNSSDYIRYRLKIESGERIVLKDEHARELGSVGDLLEQRFLDAPHDFVDNMWNSEGFSP